MLTLYGVYRSRALRPLWCLAETKIDFIHVPVIQSYRLADPSASDAPFHTDRPEFRAVNPVGQIPALEEDGLVLTESLAICLHIARKAGAPFGPANESEMSTFENWALFAVTAVEPAAIAILYTYRDGLAATPEGAARLAEMSLQLARPLAALEARLARQEWLHDRFSVADVLVAECLRYAQGHAAALADFPQTRRWLAACQARPAFQEVWERRMAEPE